MLAALDVVEDPCPDELRLADANDVSVLRGLVGTDRRVHAADDHPLAELPEAIADVVGPGGLRSEEAHRHEVGIRAEVDFPDVLVDEFHLVALGRDRNERGDAEGRWVRVAGKALRTGEAHLGEALQVLRKAGVDEEDLHARGHMGPRSLT